MKDVSPFDTMTSRPPSGAIGNLAPASVNSHIWPKSGQIPEFPVRCPGQNHVCAFH